MYSGREIIEIHKRIDSSEGKRIKNKIFDLKMSYYVFNSNYIELKALLRKYNSGSSTILESKETLDNLFAELTRLLHNFLAAASSLTDHMRVIYRDEYENTEFGTEYNNKPELFIAAYFLWFRW